MAQAVWEVILDHILSAWTLWFLGYPDQGLAQSQQAVTLAQQIAHPFCLAEALFFAAMLFFQLLLLRNTVYRLGYSLAKAGGIDLSLYKVVLDATLHCVDGPYASAHPSG